mmetsp:Transcript_10920/g.9638  ORF Transcript_10920/g.9638 Transcript_10920/m.9638 type:complete len:143 (+) Transcript_10920:140-568(+)
MKIRGGLTHIRNRAPFLGGSFAMWGGCFSTCDCLMIWLRQKDDPINACVAGFVTGGVLAARSGARNAFKNAVIGGGFLCLIEGVSVVLQAVMMKKQQMMMEQMQKMEMEKMRQAQQQNKNPWEIEFNESDAISGGDTKSFDF